jgi:hypothetical protein
MPRIIEPINADDFIESFNLLLRHYCRTLEVMKKLKSYNLIVIMDVLVLIYLISHLN